MIIYDYIWLYMILYDYIWLYMIKYDYIWIYMNIYECMANLNRNLFYEDIIWIFIGIFFIWRILMDVGFLRKIGESQVNILADFRIIQYDNK